MAWALGNGTCFEKLIELEKRRLIGETLAEEFPGLESVEQAR